MNSELEIRRLSRLRAMLSQVNKAIIRSRTVEELFPKLCGIAVEVGQYKFARIDQLDAASNLLVPAAQAGDAGALIAEEFVSDCACRLAAIKSGTPRIVNKSSVANCAPKCRDLANKMKLGVCAMYPIRLRNQVSGVLTVATTEACLWDDAEASLLEDITLNISFALDKFEAERERREIENGLPERKSEQHYKTALESALDGFYLVDMQGRLLQVNDAYCVMSGYTREELLQMRVADVEITESEQEVAAHIQRIVRQGPERFETHHRRKDGQHIDIETSVTFQDCAGGQFFCFLRNITERKRAEKELRESEERFRSVVEGCPVGILVQVVGTCRYLNPAALAMFGAETTDQLVGQPIAERIHPESRAAVVERIRALKEGQRDVPSMEQRLLRLDGTAFDVEANATRFSFEGQGGSIVFVRDISERKEEENKRKSLEQQLLQAQKMEAVGRLAGGVAHDFNNLLMVIQSYTEMLQDSLPVQDRLRKNTHEIMKAAERAASLTGQMLAFSRKQITSPVVLDLNAVIHEAAKMLKRLIGEDIEFQVNAAPSLWATKADSDQMVQVLMNLCVNARDAMPRGGTLTIASGNVTVEEGRSMCPSYVESGNYVWLSVTDTGIGINKKGQEQIFEPFYTTKEVGRGTGLGLAMVYGIVKQSSGYVWVDSELGRGASFTIYLPVVQEASAHILPTSANALPRGTETLLVVEDEDALRESICEYLRSLGYKVFAAGSGQHALSVVSEYDGKIDILITDVVMPKISGRDLSQMLESLRPDLKTIYMSGYTDDAVLRHGIHNLDATFLQKPFSLGTLARKVRETLGETEKTLQ